MLCAHGFTLWYRCRIRLRRVRHKKLLRICQPYLTRIGFHIDADTSIYGRYVLPRQHAIKLGIASAWNRHHIVAVVVIDCYNRRFVLRIS